MGARTRAHWRTTTIGITALALLSLLLVATAGAEPPATQKEEPPAPVAQIAPEPGYATAPTARIVGRGPDSYGYVWIDKWTPGGPAYTPLDIGGTGDLVAFGDDEMAEVTLPGPAFPFYGTEYGTLWVTTNGLISTAGDSFMDYTPDCPLPAVPSSGSGARIYALHTDLYGAVYHQYFASSPIPNPNGVDMGANVFQFAGDFLWQLDGIPDFEFHAVLFDNGDIVFQHKGDMHTLVMEPTIGIQNADATSGLTDWCGPPTSVPHQYALWITPTPPSCTSTAGIENGSFETGDFTGWCGRDLAVPFDELVVAHSGTFGAWGFFESAATDGLYLVRHGFDGRGPGTISLRQGISLADTVVRADLSFDWRAAWDLTFGATVDRSLDVVVEPEGGGTPLATFPVMSTDLATEPIVNDTDQQQATVDLAGYAGSTVVIGLQATVPQDHTGPATMDIDNVVLDLDHRPEVVAPIADVTVGEDAPDTVIDVGPVFSDADPEDAVLTMAIDYDNTSLFTVQPGPPVVLDYAPDAHGTATVEITVTDSIGLTATDTFVVTVNPVNDRPVAVGDGPYAVEEGGTLTVNGVLGNDTDVDGDTLTAHLGLSPSAGDLVLNPDGSFTYVHDHSDTTFDSFSYWANDGAADSELATVTIDVTPVGHTIGMVDPSQGLWHLTNAVGTVTSFFYGNPGDVPFMGDWDCDGIETPGLFRTADAFAYLSNANRSQVADIRFFFGDPDDIPLAGDFDGDGCDTLSIYRAAEQRFYIMNELGEDEGGLGAADYTFLFGNPGDKPVVGDWDGDGIDEVGLHRESTGFFYWRDTLSIGIADGTMFFGDPGDRFVAGDWGVVDGADTPAVFRPSDATYYFRHTLTQGVADDAMPFGEAGWLPVAGEFGLG